MPTPNKSKKAAKSAAATSSAPAITPLRDAPAGAPNIIFISVDQMRHDANSALGNPHVHTPNIDAIIKAGTSFLRMQASHPLCSPMRTSWITGRMPSEHGCISNDPNTPCLKTLPDYAQWLGARGYDCYHAGKWHVQGRKPEDSFHVLALSAGTGEDHDETCATVTEKLLAERTGDKPFLLNLCFINPHDCCFMAGKKWGAPVLKFGLEKVLADEMPPIRPTYNPKQPVAGAAPDQWNTERMRLNNYVYYRQCEMVDDHIGRVYRALRASRFADNTILIFSADHGEMLGEHNRLGKNVLYEGSVRVPLAFVAPGRIPANTRNDTALATGIDVTATMLDYAGAEPMPNMTIARSLRPVLEGKTKDLRNYVAAETSVQGAHVSIRHGAYKSVFALAGGTPEMEQLFNLDADPNETKNLVKTEPAVVAEHRKLLADYQSKVIYSDLYKRFLRDPKLGAGGGD